MVPIFPCKDKNAFVLFHEFERLAVYIGNIYALVQCGNGQLRYIVAVQQHLSCHVVNADAGWLFADNAFSCGTIMCLQFGNCL